MIAIFKREFKSYMHSVIGFFFMEIDENKLVFIEKFVIMMRYINRWDGLVNNENCSREEDMLETSTVQLLNSPWRAPNQWRETALKYN